MIRGLVSAIGLIALLAGCTAEPPPPVLVKMPEETLSYLEDVKPVLDRRCVVCHSCYNAACQLKLSSFEGLDRGSSKAAVYSSSRLKPQDPSRLFMDAQTTEAWRERGFTSVIENQAEGAFNDSILLGLLEAKRRSPVPSGEYHAEAADLTCPASPAELGGFLALHPERGMPFGFPALSRREYATIAGWLQQGHRGPSAEEAERLVTPSKGAAAQIDEWEALLNADDAKHAMSARYFYEHFFLAHISFSGGADGEFFELVRSSTEPGLPISVIATVRPYDAPGVDRVYYRFRKMHSTPVIKTHMVVVFDDERVERFKELFLDSDWLEEPHRVALNAESEANPFIVYAQIPPASRYRFLLDDSEYFIRTFIRGPVCKGQVALNVIHDHFWVVFHDPASDQTILDPTFLREQAENLALPNEQGSDERLLETFSDAYRDRYKAFYNAKTKLYDEKLPRGFGLETVWPGRRAADSPLLTVYRHFDSASVHRGAVGGLPRTMWMIDYSQFERIYYSLVAGFDVFGNLSHQVNVRRYMDLLRVEGELNFVELLPRTIRLPLVQSWYLGDRAVQNVDPEDVLSNRNSRIRFETDDPKRELIERVVDERLLPEAEIKFDPVNYRRLGESRPVMPSEFKTHEDVLAGFAALTEPGTEFIRHQNNSNVNVIYLRVLDYQGDDRFVSMVINRWHDNVNAMFGEGKRLNSAKDTIDFVAGSVSAYPNAFFVVEAKDLPKLFDMLQNFDGSDEYVALLDEFVVNRSDPDFWDTYDWFQKRFNEMDPLNAGLYDLNRYYPVAR